MTEIDNSTRENDTSIHDVERLFDAWLPVGDDNVRGTLTVAPMLRDRFAATFKAAFRLGGQYLAAAIEQNSDASTTVAAQTLLEYLQLVANLRRVLEQRDFLDLVCARSEDPMTREWRIGFEGQLPEELLWPSQSGGQPPEGMTLADDGAPPPPLVAPTVLRAIEELLAGVVITHNGEQAEPPSTVIVNTQSVLRLARLVALVSPQALVADGVQTELEACPT